MVPDQEESGGVSGGQAAGEESPDILGQALLLSQERAKQGKTVAEEDDDDTLYLMQTMHHVLAKALLNGWQNGMALPISAEEVPSRVDARAANKERN